MQLADSLKDAINSNASLFVYARSEDSNPAPIAVVKTELGEFPMQITLDETSLIGNANILSHI